MEALGGLLDAAVAGGIDPLYACPAAAGVSLDVEDDVVLAPAPAEASEVTPAVVASAAALTAVDGVVCADDAVALASTAAAVAVEVAASPATKACGDSVVPMIALVVAMGASDKPAQPASAAALAFVGDRRLRIVVSGEGPAGTSGSTACTMDSLPSERVDVDERDGKSADGDASCVAMSDSASCDPCAPKISGEKPPF